MLCVVHCVPFQAIGMIYIYLRSTDNKFLKMALVNILTMHTMLDCVNLVLSLTNY